MIRKLTGVLGGLIVTVAAVGMAGAPAQASIAHCTSITQSNNYQVACTGNPGTSPNQYRSWVKCGASDTPIYGAWHVVDFSDPTWSVAFCPQFTLVRVKGYNTR